MAVPEGTFQRAVFVSIPLVLIILIFVTPAFFGPGGQVGPEEVPYLLTQVTGEEWNTSVNQTGLLYVRSPLGVPIYEYVSINLSGVDVGVDLAATCGGNATFAAGNWTCAGAGIPSAWLKFPVVDDLAVNVSAVATFEGRTFQYNTTIVFGWDPSDWVLREWPDQDVDAPFRDHSVIFQVALGERR